ncbi:phage tail family protein [Actinomadura rudentiformis]|uniref:Minor tail protein n=1 Tax=Actinomadura rudentiformis TaxID=359158 RepID=A0A6H9YUL6_9ACTN|nr:phage tail domain-containing protein [Actinomadura rudentiformis]KAB2347356.1 hypothetical protein F8566_20300 [Actinomadura rudentiformis]
MAGASDLTALLDDAETGTSIPFNSGVDEFGVDWRMARLDGWDSPDLEEGAEPRSGADGLWDVENFFAGRTLTLAGTFAAPSYEEREAAEYRLRRAVPRNRLVSLRVNETTPRRVDCRRSGSLRVGPTSDVMGEFSIGLLAPDPRKYGVLEQAASISAGSGSGGLAPPWTPPVTLPAITTAPSQATLTNSGDYDSPPIITIRGPGDDISVVNYTTSKVLIFDLPLGATDYLVIDVAAGTTLLGGTSPRGPAPGSAVVAEFFMAPGDNLLRIFGTLTAASPPSAQISFYSAWT